MCLACVLATSQLQQAGGRHSEANKGGRPAPCLSLNSTRRCSAISTGRRDLALRVCVHLFALRVLVCLQSQREVDILPYAARVHAPHALAPQYLTQQDRASGQR